MKGKILIILVLIFNFCSNAFSSSDTFGPEFKYNFASGFWKNDGKSQLHVFAQYIENYEEEIKKWNDNLTGNIELDTAKAMQMQVELIRSMAEKKQKVEQVAVSIYPDELDLQSDVKKYNFEDINKFINITVYQNEPYIDNGMVGYNTLAIWKVVSGSVLISLDKPKLLYNMEGFVKADDLTKHYEHFRTGVNGLVLNVSFEDLVLVSEENYGSEPKTINIKDVKIPEVTVQYIKGS